MSDFGGKADIANSRRHVRFVPILLQKSAMMGYGAVARILEFTACHPLPREGWSEPLPPNCALLMQSTSR